MFPARQLPLNRLTVDVAGQEQGRIKYWFIGDEAKQFLKFHCDNVTQIEHYCSQYAASSLVTGYFARCGSAFCPYGNIPRHKTLNRTCALHKFVDQGKMVYSM